MKSTKTQKLVKIAMITAVYAVLTLAFPTFSYGPLQLRVSEVLTVLPVYTFIAVPSLGFGCMVANLIGFLIGVNEIGLIDAVVGSVATLVAGVLTFLTGKYVKGKARYVIAPLPTVILNALFVGAEITAVFSGEFNLSIFVINALWIGLGELIVCYALGVPFMLLMDKNDFYKKIF